MKEVVKMNKWKCSVCDYVHEGDNPPGECPHCESIAEVFYEQSNKKEDEMQTKGKYSDRRCNKRINLSFEVSLPVKDGKTINISASGVYFEVITNDREAFSPGITIPLQINTVTNLPEDRERKHKLIGRGTVIRNCIIERTRIMIIALGVALEFTEKLNIVFDND